ncbi:hypothetical protein DLM46_38115 [Paraburkholderia lacunae]|uniref:Membrane-associated oxidoreductase n=1 Tax=Paraburkholderia lacunae TaxID=2211104 RepID=A0A370MVB7_9BURK|nr:hypothetical protein DLM46_38115 [Paraburkholderia lacunae]
MSARFIEMILTDVRLRNAIPYRGVEIRGARFSEIINLTSAHVQVPVTLSHCRFDAALKMSQAVVDGQLSFDGSSLDGDVDMAGIKTSSSVVLDRATAAGLASFISADIGGQLSLNGFHIKGPFKAGAARIAKGFFASGSTFSDVSLTEARIGGELVIQKSIIAGSFTLDAVEVDQSGYLNSKTIFKNDVTLSSTHVVGQLDMSTAQIDGILRTENLTVGRTMFLRGTVINKRASMTYLNVGGNLDLSSGSFATLDLTGARIGEGLRLGSALPGRAAPRWQGDAQLILRNASARDIQDLMTCHDPHEWTSCVDGWPKHFDLVGFSYENPSVLDANRLSDLSQRPADWWIMWLGRQTTFNAQTYAQAARMLSKIDQDDKAVDVLYAGKNRERTTAHGIDRVLLTLHQVFVGYGFRTSYALWWAIGFIALGALILKLSGEGRLADPPLGVIYSIDMLLPIIRLREAHYEIDLHGWARFYFYFHKIMGYVLASFIVAGIAGLVNGPVGK